MPCPICHKPTTEQYKPFCCKRCADVDLNRWLSEVYTTPVVEMDDLPDEADEEKN